MKRLLLLILALAQVLLFCACDTPTTDSTHLTGGAVGFRVGYGKENITPTGQVGMGGYGKSDQRLSLSVLDYLYVTCLAITDADGHTILLYGMDLIGCAEAITFREDVSKATGVPVENIMMSASHTHSAPDYKVETSGRDEALDALKKGLIQSAQTAMEDRKTAKMYGGSIKTKGMNFVRHYLMNDGTYCGDNFGSSASGYKEHATEADAQLQLIKFTREGDKDIYLTNFQTHPHQTGGANKRDLSADVVGAYRTCMEETLDCEVIYLSGAGGNINSHSRIVEEQATFSWRDWGKKLAAYAAEVEFTELAVGKVQSSSYEFTAQVNHTQDAYAELCNDLYTRWSKGEINTTQLKALGEQAGIVLHSPYHAGHIRNRAALPDSETFSIQVFSFGAVGVTAFPGEQFDTNGMFIKENSPFAMTIIATKANGEYGYFPSKFAFEVSGGYEVDATRYLAGTAEKLADQYVAMLTEQFNNQ